MTDQNRRARGPHVEVVMVFHGKKAATTPEEDPIEVRANQPLTIAGAKAILALAPKIAELGPFTGPTYSSLLCRALDTASILHFALGREKDCAEIATMFRLGQMGSDDSGGDTYYPGYENQTDNWLLWQEYGVVSLREIGRRMTWNSSKVLAASHRPIIIGAYAYANGCSDPQVIHNLAYHCPLIKEHGYMVFRVYSSGEITMAEDGLPKWEDMVAQVTRAEEAAKANK